jgi:nicotinamide phosphoribosyltransferase
MKTFLVPFPLEVDAYQAGHYSMIPPGMENFQCSQGVFRKPFVPNDHRVISAGLDVFTLLECLPRLCKYDIDEAEKFYSDFHAMTKPPFAGPYPFPREMFEQIVEKYDGKLPIVVTGMRDGQAHYVGEPNVQVWTDAPGMGELVGWIESTMLPYVWTMSTVATRGRARKEKMMKVFSSAYPSKTQDEIHQMVQYKFHDFGRRGAANAQMTGIAHLINWLGTDTVDAAYVATRFLNNGEKFGACSVAAAAHRTITPWPTEDAAYQYMIEKYKGGILSIVADSYNYAGGIRKLASFAEVVKTAGGTLVGRPDSGDPVQCIIEGLEVFGEAFGTSTQETGLRVVNGAGIIQGDGVSDEVIFGKIYPAVVKNGWCPSNVVFGQGEHNHKAVRSELECAYKTCMVTDKDGDYQPVMKVSDSNFKKSLPCPVAFFPERVKNRIIAISANQLKEGYHGEYQTYYDYRRFERYSGCKFSETRSLAYSSWNDLTPVPSEDTFSSAIRNMQQSYADTHAFQET